MNDDATILAQMTHNPLIMGSVALVLVLSWLLWLNRKSSKLW